MSSMADDAIHVRGAREHNLRNVSVTLPRGKLICLTGVSGSGKSSFAFDTLFAEGQRRYLESLSSYARQFIGQLAKPEVDQITGLSPAISIQQKTSGWNPRSTVGTVTQIHDYLRVLFARVGRQHCPQCGKPIRAQSREEMIARILGLTVGTAVHVLAPVARGQKGEFRDLFADMAAMGYVRARVDGETVALTSAPALEKNVRHNIEIVVDRLVIGPSSRPRLAEAVESAIKLSKGTVIVQPVAEVIPATGRGKQSAPSGPPPAEVLLSADYACPSCGISVEPPTPQLLSFNSPQGMCPRCDGLGVTFDFAPELMIKEPQRSVLRGAIEPMHTPVGRWRRHILQGVAKHLGFDLASPWRDLPQKARDALLFGLGDTHVTFEWRSRGGIWRHGGTFDGIIGELRDKHRKAGPMVRAYYEKYMRNAKCTVCDGGRLNPQALAVRLGGLNIHELCRMSVVDARSFLEKIELHGAAQTIGADVVREVIARLTFLIDVGLDYLSLDRTAPTLSGGESQRIRLAAQIGAGLVDVLYILDEPSIGLHPRDNRRLLASLQRLRDLGNTVVVVEHDEETMRAADFVVDFGPGPGVRGGEVVAAGDIGAVMDAPQSLTGRFLLGKEAIPIPATRRPIARRKRTESRAAKTASRNPASRKAAK